MGGEMPGDNPTERLARRVVDRIRDCLPERFAVVVPMRLPSPTGCPDDDLLLTLQISNERGGALNTDYCVGYLNDDGGKCEDIQSDHPAYHLAEFVADLYENSAKENNQLGALPDQADLFFVAGATIQTPLDVFTELEAVIPG